MPYGLLLNDGQNYILNVLYGNTPVQNFYLGLMTNLVNPAVTAQIGSGITEVTGTGYARILVTRNTDWSIAGPLAQSALKIFTVGNGGWNNCNGYILCKSPAGNDAIIAQAFPASMQGNYNEFDEIEVYITQQLLDNSESCT